MQAAADAVVEFRVEYSAERGCPDARAFSAGITGRSDRVRIGSGGETTTFHVDLAHRDQRFVGQIRIAPPHAPERARAVDGESCAEVADALALIAALALDPEARS